MKTLLTAAAVLTLLPSAALAQVAAGAVPNTLDGPAAQARPQAPAATPAPARTPVNPLAEQSLRTFIAGVQAGQIDYSVMTDELAGKVREQEAAITPIVQGFGPVQAVSHIGVDGETTDLFVVNFANQATQWAIAFNEDDKVTLLLFRPAPNAPAASATPAD